ncbi:hypothetical protein LR007_03860, partial [candidate division NPL-UPA2 bacterium]|nr:hypothetical protein [candidate division NPL-UPA2 bacterium]
MAVSLGIAIYTERRPEVPPEEAVRPGLERIEEIIKEDERIKVPSEEAIRPGLEVRFEGRTLQEWKQELDSPSIERRRAAVRTLGEFGIVGILLLFK